MARKYDYEGLSLTNLRKVKGGLKKDILQAKLEAAYLLHEAQEFKDEHGSVIEPEVTKFYEIEAELVRDAIVNFLTSDKLNWTIAEMKASLELEEISTVAPLNTTVATTVSTTVNGGMTGNPGPVVGASGVGTGTGLVTEPLSMRKDGAKHGGRMKGVGHAYIGKPDIVPNSDTTDEENNFTRVRLYKDKIRKELLK